jgi:hypothetical protein
MPNTVRESSSAGKFVISRQSGAICACLAALTARQPTDDNSPALQFLSLINREQRNDESDVLYLKSIEQCFFSGTYFLFLALYLSAVLASTSGLVYVL